MKGGVVLAPGEVATTVCALFLGMRGFCFVKAG
jgi:hypothetical protein